MKQQRLLELAGISEAPMVGEENFQDLEEVLMKMHKIINPGEYGLGSEPESVPDDDKAAFEQLGVLLDNALKLIKR